MARTNLTSNHALKKYASKFPSSSEGAEIGLESYLRTFRLRCGLDANCTNCESDVCSKVRWCQVVESIPCAHTQHPSPETAQLVVFVVRSLDDRQSPDQNSELKTSVCANKRVKRTQRAVEQSLADCLEAVVGATFKVLGDAPTLRLVHAFGLVSQPVFDVRAYSARCLAAFQRNLLLHRCDAPDERIRRLVRQAGSPQQWSDSLSQSTPV